MGKVLEDDEKLEYEESVTAIVLLKENDSSFAED